MISNHKNHINHIRALTFDEKKAAEAAFRGLPLDPSWSVSAQAVYYGILAQTHGRDIVEEAALDGVGS